MPRFLPGEPLPRTLDSAKVRVIGGRCDGCGKRTTIPLEPEQIAAFAEWGGTPDGVVPKDILLRKWFHSPCAFNGEIRFLTEPVGGPVHIITRF